MLKFIFICLVIANAVLFALSRGYLTSPLSENHQPQRLMLQKNSTHLSLISPEMASVSNAAATPKNTEPVACLEWGYFQLNELAKVEAKLSALSLGNRQSRQNSPDKVTNLVFIPPLASKEAADKKASELNHLGVRDYYIIQDQSDLRWGISLGVFKSEEAARQLLATLVSKGVRSAKLGTRNVREKFDYVFKNVSSAEKAGLDNLKAEFPGQEFWVCK